MALKTYIVFFRNLNLGRPPAPTREDLESAFVSAGAKNPASFLTNGNLVFDANAREAEKILERACVQLERNGFSQPGFLRDFDYLKSMVTRNPFAHVNDENVYEFCVTFFSKSFRVPSAAPTENSKGDVRVVAYTTSEMLALSYKLGASPGSPNAFAEKTFQQLTSTRSWSTICRLVKKYSNDLS